MFGGGEGSGRASIEQACTVHCYGKGGRGRETQSRDTSYVVCGACVFGEHLNLVEDGLCLLVCVWRVNGGGRQRVSYLEHCVRGSPRCGEAGMPRWDDDSIMSLRVNKVQHLCASWLTASHLA